MYRSHIIRTVVLGIFSVLIVSDGAFAAGSCSGERKEVTKAEKARDKAQDRYATLEESTARKLQSRIDKRDRYAAQEADAARKQDECSSLGSIFIGGTRIDKAYQCNRKWSVKKHNYRTKKEQTNTYINTVLTPQINSKLGRQQARVNDANTRLTQARTALATCQNPPPGA